MRFAVISDVHGNLPALDTVLEDAEKNNVDGFIFAGDYCLSNPFPDECIQRIRAIENKLIIRGNEERYLENLIGKDQSRWNDGQMQISYYCYRAVDPENLSYILSLPGTLETPVNGVALHMAHSSVEYIADSEHSVWSSSLISEKYLRKEITVDSLRAEMKRYYDTDEMFRQRFSKLEKGIYIFGHSHVQWSCASEDGKTVLINPGSCGLPLDGITGTVPYTLLDISDNGDISVEEKRLPFDMEAYITTLKQSEQFKEANVWSNVIIRELRTAREHMFFFLGAVNEYAEKINDSRRPFAVDTWGKAYQLWAND